MAETNDNGYSILCKMILESKSVHTRFFHNSHCVSCGTVEKEMIRVGALVFCTKCFRTTFKTSDPVIEEKELYKELVKREYEKE